MSELVFNATVAPSPPASGKVSVYLDVADLIVKQKDAAGIVTPLKSDPISALLLSDPSVNAVYSITYSSGLVSQELWKRASDSSNLKRTDYTYSGGLVATEVRKVFATDGSTIIGQLTLAYAYSSGLLSSITETRDV